MSIVTEQESSYLKKEYGKINYDSKPLTKFLNEIYTTIGEHISFKKNMSFLDIGCGRGYFLKYLTSKGHKNIFGIDPCNALVHDKLFDKIEHGSFEGNSFGKNQCEIVYSCHTLHHLKQPFPVDAIKEMNRIASKYIVIVEINNTNIPMFLLSLFNVRVERNAYSYNLKKIKKMLKCIDSKVLYADHLNAMYISGDSFLYKICYFTGSRPYNITIAEKVS